LGHIAASFFIGVQPLRSGMRGRLRTRSPLRSLPTCPAPIMDAAVHITRLGVHGGGEDCPVRALPRQCRVPDNLSDNSFPDAQTCDGIGGNGHTQPNVLLKYRAFQKSRKGSGTTGGWVRSSAPDAFGMKASVGGQHLLNPSYCSCLRTSVPETQSRSRIGYPGPFDRPRLDRLRSNPVGGGGRRCSDAVPLNGHSVWRR
jgi:hypothetical protein